MEGDPFVLIEGMTIAGLAVGATQGYIYLRVEYPHAYIALNQAIESANKNGYLGENILNSGKTFHLEVRRGAGAYICGEETSLLESLEGKRGLVRFKPPLPAIVGLFGKPTVVNNVISLASVPVILDKGGEFYRNFGMGRSRGTLPLQLAGNIKHPGLFEAAFGMTLRELLYDYGGGSASGRPIRAVQVGGPLGAYLPNRNSIPRWTMKLLRQLPRCWATAVSWCMTTQSIWRIWRVTRWNFAWKNPAANAHLAESVPHAALKSSTGLSMALKKTKTRNCYAIYAIP